MSENESKMVRINVLIESEDKEKIQEICKKFDTDISKFMRQLLKKVIFTYELK